MWGCFWLLHTPKKRGAGREGEALRDLELEARASTQDPRPRQKDPLQTEGPPSAQAPAGPGRWAASRRPESSAFPGILILSLLTGPRRRAKAGAVHEDSPSCASTSPQLIRPVSRTAGLLVAFCCVPWAPAGSEARGRGRPRTPGIKLLFHRRIPALLTPGLVLQTQVSPSLHPPQMGLTRQRLHQALLATLGLRGSPVLILNACNCRFYDGALNIWGVLLSEYNASALETTSVPVTGGANELEAWVWTQRENRVTCVPLDQSQPPQSPVSGPFTTAVMSPPQRDVCEGYGDVGRGQHSILLGLRVTV